jgi:glycosyltransferase involved in cell wall biosynthesis
VADSDPRVVSVITAVAPSRSQHLGETWASLAAQHLPPGWGLQWCVQVDGPGEVLFDLPPDDRLSVARSSRSGGPALARTLCLGRARGEVIAVLDGDDRLTPGALDRALGVLDRHPRVQWATSAALDVHPDGSTHPVAGPPPGLLPPGSLGTAWESEGHRLPAHPATLCARTDAVLAAGGWTALPASEDTGLLLALDALWPGWFIAEPGLLYRKWDGQLTNAASHVDSAERHAREAVIQARLRSLRRARADAASRQEQGDSPSRGNT